MKPVADGLIGPALGAAKVDLNGQIETVDLKISQFNDFYNLETNNFDESQQQLAQRLIGYQSRDYLENLFVMLLVFQVI